VGLLRQSILSAVADPNLALALVIAGALWVYAEFIVPGTVVFGMVGSLLMLLGLKTLAGLPIAPAAPAAMAFGILCCLSNRRLATAAGVVSVVAGLWKLSGNRIHFSTAAALGVPFALITSFLLSTAARARRNKTFDRTPGRLGPEVDAQA
jgi:membrane-bound serine protease (ClpP class)